MKERPILMSSPMVRAIFDGIKTQTRRVVKPQPVGGAAVSLGSCPYGAPGDRLWVREAWRVSQSGYYGPGKPESDAATTMINYRADNHKILFPADVQKPIKTMHHDWRPSIFMPRWACRLVLEITSIGVWRLQDISESDAMAEGIIKEVITVGRPHGRPDYDMFALRPGDHCEWECTARDVYQRRLWDKLNAARGFGWNSNPWVWALTFKRVP